MHAQCCALFPQKLAPMSLLAAAFSLRFVGTLVIVGSILTFIAACCLFVWTVHNPDAGFSRSDADRLLRLSLVALIAGIITGRSMRRGLN